MLDLAIRRRAPFLASASRSTTMRLRGARPSASPPAPQAPGHARAAVPRAARGGPSPSLPAPKTASRREPPVPSRWSAWVVCWWRLGGLGTFAPVKGSLGVDRLLRALRRPWAAIALVCLFGIATVAQAEPAPVQPVKPEPVKPVGTPAQPAAKPAPTAATPVQPATTPAQPQPSKPSPAPAAEQPASGPDPFAPVPAGSGAPSNPNVRESELYGDRLDNLQGEVDELKDKIFRSKARLTLLKETVLKGVLAGSRVTIAHQNLMSSGFRLTRVVVSMDGAQIFARTDETGSLDGEDELVVFDGNLPPGPHAVTVKLEYRGNGYGVFSYLNGYTFKSGSTHSFTAPENGALKLVSQGFEKGNMTTEMRDRPAVHWQEVPLDAAGRPLPKSRSRGARAKKDSEP